MFSNNDNNILKNPFFKKIHRLRGEIGEPSDMCSPRDSVTVCINNLQGLGYIYGVHQGGF